MPSVNDTNTKQDNVMPKVATEKNQNDVAKSLKIVMLMMEVVLMARTAEEDKVYQQFLSQTLKMTEEAKQELDKNRKQEMDIIQLARADGISNPEILIHLMYLP